MSYDSSVYTLREWAPLTDLLNKLPAKSHLGLFSQDVKLTCVDVLPEFLALGTNSGVIYWYDRKNKDLQQLRSEKQNIPITALKIISTVDFMVASGSQDGSINVFQIPKSYPDSIPETLRPKNKQVERYTVSDLHKSTITAIEWAKNGMKLFSGDKNGCIVLTEIDFYMHICKSSEIINESYEVVQLNYCQQRLLVSTTFRSIICQKQEKWIVSQVGKKDRKILGKFGGLIHQSGPREVVLYCTRPGLRIWIADSEGNVNKTLLFKDLLCMECFEVPIINPISSNIKTLKPQTEPSFGTILPFHENLILTYSDSVIYILDPEKMAVIATMSHFRNVLSVASYKDEIFVLEEERSLIRVSYTPESSHGQTIDSTSQIGNSFLPITNSIKEITNKLQSSSIIPAISPFLENNSASELNVYTDNTLIMNAEEAKESPIKSRNSELEKKFNSIGKQEFNEQILYKQTRHKKKNSLMTTSLGSWSSNSSDEKDNFMKPSLMTLSSVGVLPDLRSPESIENDIEYKEKILADILNLGKIKINLDHVKEQSDDSDEEGPPSPPYKNSESHHFNSVVDETSSVDPKIGNVPSGSSQVDFISQHKVPACMDIPTDWKLSNIQLNSKNDSSLSDWEII